MLKYFLEYTDTVGIPFRCEISDVNFSGTPIEINGSGSLEFSSVSDLLEPIRGSVFTLDLEASIDLDLNDLYSENETDISIEVFRNAFLMFKGFIKPDGIYTDFVNEIYTISLDCVDGLGTLKDLSFVNTAGFPFKGFMKEIDIVYNCLLRTSFDLPINVNIGLFHNEILEVDEGIADILNETKLSTERFYKADKEEKEVMDCEEVLKAVLEKYCAIIHQFNGEWYVYRPQDFATLETSYFHRYESGVRVTDTDVKYYEFNLGSQIDSYYPHHCNGNQRININGSVSAFRVNYKYGLLNSFFYNPNLEMIGGVVDGWTLNYPFTAWNENGGLVYDGLIPPTMAEIPLLVSSPVQFDGGYKIKFDLSSKNVGAHIGMTFQIKITNGTDTMYYSDYGNVWRNTPSSLRVNYNFGQDFFELCEEDQQSYDVKYGLGDFDYTKELTETPFDGQVTLILYDIEIFDSPSLCYDTPLENYTIIKSINITQSQNEKNDKKGETHTVYRSPKSSSITEDNKEVFNGDMVSDIYEGTIKTADNNNTISWRHKGKEEAKEILQIMVEDTLKSRIKPQKVFVGDVYGFMPFLRSFKINNVQGFFMPLNYSYDTKENIVSLELVEVPNDIDSIDMKYEKTIDYGNVIKPTIV